jgi:hypothetical protein
MPTCRRCITEISPDQKLKSCERCLVYCRQYRRKWEKFNYHNNINYRLGRIGRSRINHAFKCIGTSKKQHTIEYLGCTPHVLKTHLEAQFLDGMNWDNIGTVWEVDHKIPIMFDNPTTDQVIKRLHFSNCSPLWKAVNRSKGNRYIG